MSRFGRSAAALCHFPVGDDDLDRLLTPSRHYSHPQDVLADANVSMQEKRAILASWVSDACSVPSKPSLRQLPGVATPVAFDDIMEALRSLDYGPSAGAVTDQHTPSRTCDA